MSHLEFCIHPINFTYGNLADTFYLLKQMDRRFEVGDQVRIDIPVESDPDKNRLHGRRGEIVGILEDDADDVTGNVRDSM